MAGKKKTETNNTIDPFSQGQITTAVNNTRGILNDNPFQAFEGQTTAGINDTQRAAQSQFQTNQGIGTNALQQAGGLASQAGNFTAQTFAGADLNPFLNPFQQNVIDSTTGELNRQNNIALNDVNSNAQAAGAFGGSRHGLVEAEQRRNHGTNLSNTVAGLNAQNFNSAASLFGQDADRQVQAANLNLQGAGLLGDIGTSLGNENRANANTLNTFGQQEQATEQHALDVQRQEFLRGEDDPFRRAQIELGILGGVPTITDGTTTQTSNPGLLGVAGLGLQAGAAFSDRALKTNIKRIGSRHGLPWYSYNYIWDSATTHEGVMADEAPSHAVTMTPLGFEAVNYGAL